MSQSQEASPLVESMDDFFDKAGPMPTDHDDVRRFPRFYFRSCAEAYIYPLSVQPDAEPVHHFLLTTSLSRGGVSLIHKDQLFPGQRLDVVLNGEPSRATEVVWCKRLAPARYAIGCRFCAPQSEEPKNPEPSNPENSDN